MSTTWDPDQYLRFGDERSRPFWDLVQRVPVSSPGLVVDLGCGPGNLTAQLSDLWPGARVIGVDSSEEMISRAEALASDSLSFALGDLRTWSPPQPVDVLVSNAALQWVADHAGLFERLLGFLAPGGAFAFQVPGNFGCPSHVLLRELATSDRWAELMAPAVASSPSSSEPAEYLHALFEAGAASVDAWETTYLHVLEGPDAVLEWITGTGLRPFLRALETSEKPSDREDFLTAYGAALRAAYPMDPTGRTVFPFRRIFSISMAVQGPAGVVGGVAGNR
ncbi:MAG: methyltransferase domain-containing protein [Acidimicrobiales bacterium]|nr:methyltransferase domain-containing protein [Acidimicrobiales bacterium]